MTNIKLFSKKGGAALALLVIALLFAVFILTAVPEMLNTVVKILSSV